MLQVTTLLAKKEGKEQQQEQQQPPSAEQLQQLREQVSAQGGAVKDAKAVRRTAAAAWHSGTAQHSSRGKGIAASTHSCRTLLIQCTINSCCN